MMMQALEAGGLPVYYNRDRNAVNEFHTDGTKRPNPKGLYEPSQQDFQNVEFPRQHDGKAIKILIPRMGAMAVAAYRVIIMKRDPEQIMDSYERAFGDFWDTVTRKEWINSYESRFIEAVRQFQNRRDVWDVQVVNMTQLLLTPRWVFTKLAWPINVPLAASVVKVKSCPAV